MKKNYFNGDQIKKIAIFRALKLGDMLCAVPAFRNLRANFPEAEISLISLPWAKEFYRRFPEYFDNFIEFPGFPGMPEKNYETEEFIKFLTKLKEENFDLVIQMHGSGVITNPLIKLFEGRKSAGFYLPTNYNPDPSTFFEYPEAESEVNRNLLLLQKLGLKINDKELEFPITKGDLLSLKRIYSINNLKQSKYVCIHPGATSSIPWDPVKFAALGNRIYSLGFKIVITGTKNEEKIANMVERHIGSAINLCGKTDLGTLAALLKNSNLLISNDTGVSHLADALKVPSVVVFTNSDPNIWSPLDKSIHKIVLSDELNDLKQALAKIYELKKGAVL